ncbi:nuclear transport factor 2 family protein [Rhodococcus globerulus]|uniref:nuclear transport factor 2 family protein n=1 Tax=Rhodococcus globerulus TaxID=33008 RepID=UPI0030194479
MTDITALVHSLLERVQILEDEIAIQKLVTAYGPAVDAGEADKVGAMWTEDAVYDIDIRTLNGRSEIAEMVRTTPHQDYINTGCGHILAPLNIVVDGDKATATGHSQLLRRNEGEDSFRVWRVAANRFDLVKISGEWKIKQRTTRLLDGSSPARDLLARAGN